MLVLDANILIRAVLGVRVHSLLQRYAARVEFFAPDTAFTEARRTLPIILETRNLPVAPALAVLELLEEFVHQVDPKHTRASSMWHAFESSGAMKTIGQSWQQLWPWLLDLDRRYGFFRLWRRNLDHTSCGVVPFCTFRRRRCLSKGKFREETKRRCAQR